MGITLAVMLALAVGGAQETDRVVEVPGAKCSWSRDGHQFEIVLEPDGGPGVFRGEFTVPGQIEAAPLEILMQASLNDDRWESGVYFSNLDTILVDACEYLNQGRGRLIRDRERRAAAKSYSPREAIRRIENGKRQLP